MNSMEVENATTATGGDGANKENEFLYAGVNVNDPSTASSSSANFVFSLVDDNSSSSHQPSEFNDILNLANFDFSLAAVPPEKTGSPPLGLDPLSISSAMDEIMKMCQGQGQDQCQGDATPLERHSTAEIPITTPIKPRGPARVGGFLLEENEEDEDDDSEEPLDAPLYAWLINANQEGPSSARKAKLPSALPLQKVLKRKALALEEASEKQGPVCYEESDGEVVILMDGIMTKVGKPSETANSGKIYSTALNCPITVKWLLENFESMVGQSLPRSFVYDQYVQHCALNKIESVNAASFGKLIRSVFLGLRTRRLGTRGNSKYHYYGIKIKETSFLLPILNSIRAEQDTLNDTVNGRIRKRVRRTQSVYTGKHVKGLLIDKKIEAIENLGRPKYQFPEMQIQRNEQLPEGIDLGMLESFEDMYKRHCLKLVNFFLDFKLIDVLAEVANFWRLSLTFKRKGLEDYSAIMTKPALFKVLTLDSAQIFISRMDLYMYQHIINILAPSILQPLPLQMLQAIDNMIQDLLSILSIALNGLPRGASHNKLRSLTAFVRVWKQYSKMSQLSDFIQLLLENDNHLAAMRHNIKAIRLAHICQRAAMDVESETMTFAKIFKMMCSFARTLNKEQSLGLWCRWAEKELMKIVGPVMIDMDMDSVGKVETVTADMHSSWLIVSNLVVNAIREVSGSDSSLFVPMLQWCGELMQYFRQRLLDDLRKVMPTTRFYMALIDEDMSISFTDKHKARVLASVLPPPPPSANPSEPEPEPGPSTSMSIQQGQDQVAVEVEAPPSTSTSTSGVPEETTTTTQPPAEGLPPFNDEVKLEDLLELEEMMKNSLR